MAQAVTELGLFGPQTSGMNHIHRFCQGQRMVTNKERTTMDKFHINYIYVYVYILHLFLNLFLYIHHICACVCKYIYICIYMYRLYRRLLLYSFDFNDFA